MYHIFKLQQNKSIWNFSFMLSHTVYFAGMMVFTLTSQMYHRISVLVPVLVRVPEYLSTSTSTSTMTFELTSTSTVWVPEIQYSSTSTPALFLTTSYTDHPNVTRTTQRSTADGPLGDPEFSNLDSTAANVSISAFEGFNSLRPRDAYMRRWISHHCFR